MDRIHRSQKYIGRSTDTKPTLSEFGSTFYEEDTGYLWIYNGFAWIPKCAFIGQTVNYKQMSLNQAAATYDAMTATAQSLFMDAVIVHVPDDLSAVATFTGISVQTDDTTPVEILSAIAGAKANLAGNFYHVFRGPRVNASTKKIRLTIGGATAGAGKVANITVLWRPLVAGGYYLNA
jgi:hypothetical protein